MYFFVSVLNIINCIHRFSTDTYELSVNAGWLSSGHKFTPLLSLNCWRCWNACNTFQFTLNSYSVYSSLLYSTYSSVIIAFPHTLTNNLLKLLLIYASQGSTENTFFTVRSVLDNANSYSLISGVYGTARPTARSTASNIFLTKSLLLIVGLSGHLCTMYSHKYRHKGHGHIQFLNKKKQMKRKKL